MQIVLSLKHAHGAEWLLTVQGNTRVGTGPITRRFATLKAEENVIERFDHGGNGKQECTTAPISPPNHNPSGSPVRHLPHWMSHSYEWDTSALPGWILAVNFRGWKRLFLTIFGQFWVLIKGIPPIYWSTFSPDLY